MAMKLLVAIALFSVAGLASGQQQSPTHNPQDVPTERPGSDHPDVGKQRKPSHKPTGTDAPQQKADVPEQKPGTDNPDIGSQRQPVPKKKKQNKPKSTATDTN
jgi:hypothetical protein